jgi:hypothetical protein
MRSKILVATVGAVLMTSMAGCGGGSGSHQPAVAQSADVPILLSDASSEDWSMIGVKVLSIALVPQGGGNPVTVYTAASPAPVSNLAQLDEIADLVNTASIPVGTYTSATLTLSANPGDVLLTVAPDPESGFPVAAGTTIDPGQIQVQGAQGASGSRTVAIKVKFDSPLTVSASQPTPVDLEFDLAHPAFIVDHLSPADGGASVWAVNFNGPVRHHPIADLTHLVLRHLYGSVSSVASDSKSITIARDLPAIPIQSPETAVPTGKTVTILADATNGTLYYDVDARTAATIKDFSAMASSLAGKYVRVAARYQSNGTLVATRVWSSSTFNSVWVGPEGHVVHVDAPNARFFVSNDQGRPVPVTVDSNTQFFFPRPDSPSSETTPIGSGPGFLGAPNFVRGFKVHLSVVDPLATPLVAQTVDIESAAFDGRITKATMNGFTYSRNFATTRDGYTVTLPYISSTTANGRDGNGNAVTGFKFWDFAYPILVTSGNSAISDFIAITADSVDFGGVVGKVVARGMSHALWGDPANLTGWSARWAVLLPTPLPRGTVASGLSGTAFTMTALGGTNAATVDVSTTPGSATLVYQVDRSNGIVTVTPEDITTNAGLTALTDGLTVGAPVKVYGLPQADGTLKAYTLVYFTGTLPTRD